MTQQEERLRDITPKLEREPTARLEQIPRGRGRLPCPRLMCHYGRYVPLRICLQIISTIIRLMLAEIECVL